MNLRKAAALLIVGMVYTVLQKAAYGLFPGLGSTRAGGAAMSVMWSFAALTLIVFAWQFLRELRPYNRPLRYALVVIIVMTALVILAKVPFASEPEGAPRLLFRGAALLNSLAILVFIVSLARLVGRGSPVRVPLQVLSWSVGLGTVLGMASVGYLIGYSVTRTQMAPMLFLQPVALLSFMLTYGSALWFLAVLWRTDLPADVRAKISGRVAA